MASARNPPRPARPAGVIALAIALVAAAAALAAAREVLLLGFVALLVAVAFSFPVGWLSRFLPRDAAAVVTLLFALALAAGLALLAWPVVARQVAAASVQVPKGVRIAQEWLQGRRGGPVASLPPASKRQVNEKVQERVGELVATGVSRTLPIALHAAEGVIGAIVLLILAGFLVARPDAYRCGLRRLVPPERRALFDLCWGRVGSDLRRWVGGIAVSMLLMGTFTGAGLALAGVDGWLLLGLVTLLATSVPYVGAITSAVPGLAVALGQGTGTFLAACGVYLGVHVVEGYVVEPLVMKRAVEVRPALLLLAQAFFGAVFGVIGVVVSTPLLVCGRTLVDVLWVERIERAAGADAGPPAARAENGAGRHA